jgi:chromosome segregation ATPase
MSTRSFFDKIIGRQRQRERTALTGYQQLVEAVAHQTEPEVEEVERLLADSGKTVEDLQRDSERLMRRLGYKDALERLPALHKERAQLDAQIAAADRVLEEAEAAHDEATRPLYERRSEVDRAIREAQDAEAKLVTECEDAELRRELEDVDAEQRPRHRQIEWAQSFRSTVARPLLRRGLAYFAGTTRADAAGEGGAVG